jgi:DNA repair protein RadC
VDCVCTQESRIRALETGQAETRVYVKEIREDIVEIKATLAKLIDNPPRADPKPEPSWQPVMTELIKLVGQVVVILGAIAGATKLMGR